MKSIIEETPSGLKQCRSFDSMHEKNGNSSVVEDKSKEIICARAWCVHKIKNTWKLVFILTKTSILLHTVVYIHSIFML